MRPRAKRVGRIMVRTSHRGLVVAAASCASTDELAVLRVSRSLMGVARKKAPGVQLYVDLREIEEARRQEEEDLKRVRGNGRANFLDCQIDRRLRELKGAAA